MGRWVWLVGCVALIACGRSPLAAVAPQQNGAPPAGSGGSAGSAAGGAGGTGGSRPVIVEVELPTAGCQPRDIVAGPDGKLWFTEYACGKIGSLTTDGIIVEYPVHSDIAGTGPEAITTGGDGNLWLTQPQDHDVKAMTTTGDTTFWFRSPHWNAFDITTDREGNVWFTDGQLNRVLADGSVKTFATVANGVVAASPDGKLWYADDPVSYLAPDGTVARLSASLGEINGLAAAADGTLWATTYAAVHRIWPDGATTTWALADADAYARGITVAPDGGVWFTEQAGNRIGRLTTAGELTSVPLPHPDSWPRSITVGPDGNLWFVEEVGDRIGRITP